ncbi:MAG: hypothetical protein RIM99_09045 [Cyclobacteriaceae bacterium]
MAGNRGLKRLAFFVVFLIPVGWYLFLQLFGSNTFALKEVISIPESCKQFSVITVVYTADSLSAAELNHFNRVSYRTSKKDIPLIADSQYLNCTQLDTKLLLVDQSGVWGYYEMSREGVDRLLTELDILIIQKSYDKGTNR